MMSNMEEGTFYQRNSNVGLLRPHHLQYRSSHSPSHRPSHLTSIS